MSASWPYANLLSREPSTLNPHGDKQKNVHLLVVLPGGFGGANLGEGVGKALSGIEIQGEAQSDGLAAAAIGAGTSSLLFVAPAVLLFGGLFVAGRIAAKRADDA